MTAVIRVEVEALDQSTNAWVIRTPGRTHPGIVVQGDTLSSWCTLADAIAQHLNQSGNADPELVLEAVELADLLRGHLLHYDKVLRSHGLDLPHP